MRPINTQPKHDGITRAGLDAQDERILLYTIAHGRCQVCGEPVAFSVFQLAHRIANTRANRRKYGAAVIDNPINKLVTHPGRCNDAANCGYNPEACRAIVREIGEAGK